MRKSSRPDRLTNGGAPRTESPAPERTGPAEGSDEQAGFWQDLRAVTRPGEKWHYLFHLLVVLAGLSYWVGSWVLVPGASWAEVVMYRPRGDNQLWPVVTALSQLNFGDPTDVVNYGRGVGGFHAVILFPYALAYAVLGGPGYMVVDVLAGLAYLAAATMLLRRCGVGPLGSLILASALATGSLQMLSQKLSQAPVAFLQALNLQVAEWGFPNLWALTLFEKRIPRPMLTELFVVLGLYFCLRQWQERRVPGLARGAAVGVVMGLLAQGDPYSFGALGLVLGATILVTWSHAGRRVPWRYLLGLGSGLGVACAYFFYQLAGQSAESAVRFGLASYARTELWLLPGYAPELRVAAVCLLAATVFLAVRPPGRGESAPRSADGRPAPGGPETHPSVLIAWFGVSLVSLAWLAQPVQLWLLGKGAQIYHYAYYTLPMFYSYAVLLLLVQLGRLSLPAAAVPWLRERARRPGWAGGTLLLGLVGLGGFLALEEPITTLRSNKTSRVENLPWAAVGDQYRPCFHALDKAFREEPVLRQARSFATFCHEVNFLLTAFHDKRAYLPDNGFTTLSDDVLEQRLCEMARVCSFSVQQFANFIHDTLVMNYWLGCAKYWCASDHKFSSESDYLAQAIALVRVMPKQAPFNLVMPLSEMERLVEKYVRIATQPPPVASYPDVIVTTVLLKAQHIVPRADLYREVYTNLVFSVYEKRR